MVLACVIGSQLLFAGQTVVFLQTTLPYDSPTVSQKPSEPAPEVLASEEDRLINLLRNEDLNVAYEKQQNDNPWQVVRMRVTGYCACPKCCGSYSDGITASNHKIGPGDVFVAADKTYSFGTEMVIPGYHQSRPVKVLDRGGLIKGNRLDVFFHSHQLAREWGVQYLDVLVKAD
jgi:3D (Asp-Asp-Asp) domain-containing protein